MRILIVGAGLALLAGPAMAVVPDLGHPIDGYTYFHKAGETMESHDAAVDACAEEASKAAPSQEAQAFGQAVGGAVGGLIAAGQQGQVNDQVFAANLENCMVVKGWEVREFDMKDGAILTAMKPPQRAKLVAQWVGAPTAMGWLDRTYQPIAQMRLHIAEPGVNVKPSISLLAGTHKARGIVGPPDRKSFETVAVKPQAAPAAPAEGKAIIVVRTAGTVPTPTQLRIAKLEPGADGQQAGGKVTVLDVSTDHIFRRKDDPVGPDYVFEVPPGRWRLIGEGPINFCFGGPAFDVAAGEVVFAGAFSPAQAFNANLDMTATRAALGSSSLAEKLKPAAWVEGGAFGCGWLPAMYFYSLDLKDWLAQPARAGAKAG
jgi:hypothetical protein